MLAYQGFSEACGWLKECLAHGPSLLRHEVLQALDQVGTAPGAPTGPGKDAPTNPMPQHHQQALNSHHHDKQPAKRPRIDDAGVSQEHPKVAVPSSYQAQPVHQNPRLQDPDPPPVPAAHATTHSTTSKWATTTAPSSVFSEAPGSSRPAVPTQPFRTPVLNPAPTHLQPTPNRPNSNGASSYPAQLSLSPRQPRGSVSSLLLQRLEQGPVCEDTEEADAGGGAGAVDTPRWTWLTSDRKDAQGRRPADPMYDPTTLHVPEQALRAMSSFNRQFWQLKREAMDVVLFVRHGSFYNLFDVDADVGLRVGLALSGARRNNMWKVGCTKDAFPSWCAKVLALGYSVGRVEEVHQGQQQAGKAAAQGCKGKGGGGGGGNILQRHLVRIYTPSTTLDMAGDDTQQAANTAAGTQPLMAVVEAAGGHLGVALLHAGIGLLEVGQLPCSGPGRTLLHTLLLRYQPAEAVAPHAGLSSTTLALLARYHRASAAAPGGQLGGGGVMCGPSCALLSTLPANAFKHSVRSHSSGGFSPCSHVTPLETAAMHCQQALGLCQQLLGEAGMAPGQRHEEVQGPDSVLRVLKQAAAAQQPLAVQAVAVLLQHLQRCCVLQDTLTCVTCQPLDVTQTHSGAAHTGPARRHLHLDYSALTTLEVVEGSLGGVQGSLLQVLDFTATHMGRRKLRQWLCRPLSGVTEVEERLQVVELFMRDEGMRQELQAGLSALPDLPRLLIRGAKALDLITQSGCQQQSDADSAAGHTEGSDAAVHDTSACTSWVAAAHRAQLASLYHLLDGLLTALQEVHNLCTALSTKCPGGSRTPLIQKLVVAAEQVLPIMESMLQVFDLEQEQTAQPPATSASWQIHIRQGASPAYDSACSQVEAAEQHVRQVVERLKQQLVDAGGTVAQCRKVQVVEQGQMLRLPAALEPVLSKVLGCRLIQRSGASLIISTPSLTAAAQQLAALQAHRDQLLAQVVGEAAGVFRQGYAHVQAFLDALAAVDVLAGLATATCPAAAPPGCCFCRPVLTDPPQGGPSGKQLHHLRLDNAWHPCLPATRLAAGTAAHHEEQEDVKVVPNSLALGGGRPQSPLMLLLTGANMGGKSTLLRTTCIAVIMAHLGCYVPATCAHMTLVDSIFTRMGAHDRIMSGESTFMVEMSETAAGLLGASPASLVVLDELGRGTATHDGYALAYAVLWHLGHNTGARTLFATHYHDLTRELSLLPLVSLGHMAHTLTPDGDFMPLHVLRPGPALQGSSGIEVAGLAGLPRSILDRARQQATALARRMQARHSCQGVQQLDDLLGGRGATEPQQEDRPLSNREVLQLQEAVRTLRSWLRH